jgi:hypothetical protein
MNKIKSNKGIDKMSRNSSESLNISSKQSFKIKEVSSQNEEDIKY